MQTSPVRRRWGHAVVALIVLLAGLAATGVIARHERNGTAEAASKSFVSTAGNIGDQTRLHLSRYEDLLASLQVLHRAEPRNDSRDFGHTLAQRAADRRYAGYQAIVIATRAPGAPVNSAITAHIEPHTQSAADLGISATNAAALNDALFQAAHTGAPTVTSPLPLTDNPNGPVNLVMWAPLYRDGRMPPPGEERREHLVGWTGVAFRGDQFFNEALVRTTEGVGSEVFIGSASAGNRIAVRPPSFKPYDGPERVSAIAAAGRLWTLRMQPLPVGGAPQTSQRVILIAGALLSGLLALFIGSLGRSKNHALRLVDEKTDDLRRSEERFRSLAQASPLGVFSLSADGHCEYANERLCELTGRTLDDLRGSGLSQGYHPDDRDALRKAVTGGDQRSSALRLRLLLPDGSLRWVKTHAAPLHDDRDRLAGWVGSVEDVTTEVEAQIASQRLSIELAHQARHDHLTGLPNRTFFTEQTTALLEDSETDGVAVIFFDVDRFKVVNDSLGHDAGDRLLMLFGDLLRATVRPGDIAARFGGDEFVIGLVGVNDPDKALYEAERLMSVLNHTQVVDGHEITVSVSMGVALGMSGADAKMLMTRADSAMYRAKARGKARVELYREALPTATGDSTLDLERQLRHAISNHELRLMYQPIMSVGSSSIVGVEALVRWQHPQRGFMPPGDFIPLAEESGLVVPLGAWVLREACAQLAQWGPLLDGVEDFSVAVNVSARQLADPLFGSVVATALSDFGTDPSSICLEITESALLADLDMAEEVLDDLRALGIRIAVDDFGTGYSSLSHLKLLPVDVLKIDRSFVNDLGVDADNTAIVGAVIQLAGALGLTSVAEGVEETDQLNWLASMGCDRAQGYLLARPQAAGAVAELLAAGPLGPDDMDADAAALQPVSQRVSPTAR